MPPIKCIPCRIRYNGENYRIYKDGSASVGLSEAEARGLGLMTVRAHLDYEENSITRYLPESSEAKTLRREAFRLRRNRNTRERNQARLDLGLKQTPYGWE